MTKLATARQANHCLILSVFLLLNPAIPGLAQTKVTLSGTVEDDSGGVIPTASIAATNLETHKVFHATTDSTGQYRIQDLPAGKYTVSASKTGFQRSDKTGVGLHPNAATQVNFVMRFGNSPLGKIDAKIRNSSGTVVSGVTIDLTAVATGAVWQGTSDSNGEYQFSGMPCVEFDVQVTAPNGAHANRHIHLNAGAPLVMSIVLQ
jgi:hypothetical protein